LAGGGRLSSYFCSLSLARPRRRAASVWQGGSKAVCHLRREFLWGGVAGQSLDRAGTSEVGQLASFALAEDELAHRLEVAP